MGNGESNSVDSFPRLVEWKAKGRIVKVDNVELFYYSCEDFAESLKPRLVLIHGYPTSSFDYFRVLPILEQYFSVFVWDLLGFGFSEKTYAPSGKQVTLLISVFEQLFQASVSNPLEFHILSHDLGDTVVQEILAREQEFNESERPYEVLSWVAMNGGMIPAEHRRTILQSLLLNKWVGPIVGRFATINTLRRGISVAFGPDTQPTTLEYEEWWAILNHNGGEKLRAENIKYINDRLTNNDRYVGAMKNYSAEHGMLLINGPYDPVSGRHAALTLQSQVPNARVILLDDRVGH